MILGDLRFTAEVEFEFVASNVHYTPERPAPRCSNHDDPRFSDPGDSEECEFDKIFLVVRNEKEERRIELPQEIRDSLVDFVYEQARSAAEEKSRSYAEERAEHLREMREGR